jgi:hypothetical protein
MIIDTDLINIEIIYYKISNKESVLHFTTLLMFMIHLE